MVSLLQHTSICVGPANAPCACSSPPGTAMGMAPLDRAEQTQCAPVPGGTGRDEAGAAAPCPMLPRACSPQQPALPGIGASLVPQGLFFFLPQPPGMLVAARAGRAAYLIGAVSLGAAAGGGGAVARWFQARGSAGNGAGGASSQAS